MPFAPAQPSACIKFGIAKATLALRRVTRRLARHTVGEAALASRRFHDLDYARVAIRHRHAPLPLARTQRSASEERAEKT